LKEKAKKAKELLNPLSVEELLRRIINEEIVREADDNIIKEIIHHAERENKKS